jgi:hypothetical protein
MPKRAIRKGRALVFPPGFINTYEKGVDVIFVPRWNEKGIHSGSTQWWGYSWAIVDGKLVYEPESLMSRGRLKQGRNLTLAERKQYGVASLGKRRELWSWGGVKQCYLWNC